MNRILATGDRLQRSRDAAVLYFSGARKVLSTAALNGGLRSDLTAVFNHNDCPRAGAYCEMAGETMWEHQAHTARLLGLDPQTVTGLHTGANIDNTAIQSMQWDDCSVTAIVTAGLDVNACRVGNPAQLHETDGRAAVLGGTVNILLLIDADLTDGCMTRALVTCTEAKVAAIQELLVADCYSPGLATGSGTDGTVVISNSDSPTKLSEAGESFKLGELIGTAVMKAVKEALYRQSGLSAGVQHNVFRRLERFGVTRDAVWQEYRQVCGQPVQHAVFADMMDKMAADGWVVTIASLYAHLIDQMLWGLLLPQEAAEAGVRLLELLNRHHAMPDHAGIDHSGRPQQLATNMAEAFTRTIVQWVLGSC